MRRFVLLGIAMFVVFIPTVGNASDQTSNKSGSLTREGPRDDQFRVYSLDTRELVDKIANKFISLAKETFPDLLPSEYFLLYGAAMGQGFSCQTGIDSVDNLAHADNWPTRRHVRAEVLRWLCASPTAVQYVDQQGIYVEGICIKGELDLSYITVPFPLKIQKSFFPDGLNLCFAHIPLLKLSGSRVAHLIADGLQVDYAVFLNNNFRAEGQVKLDGAMLGSNLECTSGTFCNSGGTALTLSRCEIKGSVMLQNCFRAEGLVKLVGAVIGGDLICACGKFINPSDCALDMSRIKVNGIVGLNKGFKAEGMVCLNGAVIGGQILCAGGTFANSNSTALCIEGCKVEHISLDEGFRANGLVTIAGSSIGGQVVCWRGLFSNPKDIALCLYGCEVSGDVWLDGGFIAKGKIILKDANIRGGLQCSGGTFDNPDSVAIDAGGMHVRDVIFTDSLFGEGEFLFLGITVENSFIWRGFSCPEKILLDLRYSTINNFRDDTTAFPKQNQLYLTGLAYNQLYDSHQNDTKLRLKWLRLQPATKFSTQPYGKRSTNG